MACALPGAFRIFTLAQAPAVPIRGGCLPDACGLKRVRIARRNIWGWQGWYWPRTSTLRDRDWWFLVIEDGGEMHVEHKQVRHNPFKRIRREVRTRSYSIKELFATTRHEPRASLRAALRQ